jgi:hypothetical protein
VSVLAVAAFDVGRVALVEHDLLLTLTHFLTVAVRSGAGGSTPSPSTLRVVGSVAAQLFMNPLPSFITRLSGTRFRDATLKLIEALWAAASVFARSGSGAGSGAPTAFAVERCRALWPASTLATIHVLTTPLYVRLMSAPTTTATNAKSRAAKNNVAALQAKAFSEELLPHLLLCERFGNSVLNGSSSDASACSELAAFIRRGLLQKATPHLALTIVADYSFAPPSSAAAASASDTKSAPASTAAAPPSSALAGAHLTIQRMTLHAEASGFTLGVKCEQRTDSVFVAPSASTAAVGGSVYRCEKCWPAPTAAGTTASAESSAATVANLFSGLVSVLPGTQFVALPAALLPIPVKEE